MLISDNNEVQWIKAKKCFNFPPKNAKEKISNSTNNPRGSAIFLWVLGINLRIGDRS